MPDKIGPTLTGNYSACNKKYRNIDLPIFRTAYSYMRRAVAADYGSEEIGLDLSIFLDKTVEVDDQLILKLPSS